MSVDAQKDAGALAERLSLGYPLIRDDGMQVTDAYGVREAGKDHPGPATFVLDGDRKVVFRHVGRSAGDRPSPEAILRALGT